MFIKKEFAIISNLRFISRKNFMLSLVMHEKSLIPSGPVYSSVFMLAFLFQGGMKLLGR